MDAVKYLKEKSRMTDDCNISCSDCPIGRPNNGTGEICREFQNQHPEEAVAIVKKWSKENPMVTIQDKLLEVFPDVALGNDGTPENLCPDRFGYKRLEECERVNCQKCWSQPYVKKS